MNAYDIVTVGGGLGGAVAAKVMAEAGARVLVLERSGEFRDRVRGEVLVPWGAAEAQALGVFDLLHDGCGHDLRFWATDVDGVPALKRDIAETSQQRLPVVTYYHPTMQDLLLEAAATAGAEIRRDARVSAVDPGQRPTVTFKHEGSEQAVAARLVVGADGRGSMVRKWAGFASRSDRQRRMFAGVLLDGMTAPEDTLHARFAPSSGLMSWVFPQGGERVRSYIGYQAGSDFARLSGEADMPRFVDTATSLGVPAEQFAGAVAAGPLVTFDATDNWVEHPYREGVALVGDAAATSDPTWGQGMSLTLSDVRLLRDQLVATDDWSSAGDAYALEHDAVHRAVHTVDGWYTDLFLEVGPDADAMRARALPLIAGDPTRIPDTPISGPGLGFDEEVRRRFFGEV